MKPLSERDENKGPQAMLAAWSPSIVGMKPLSERDENGSTGSTETWHPVTVGMKPLSERDENSWLLLSLSRWTYSPGRNEATL